MNYGFAYRLATYAALREFARQAFGARMSLVVDSPHNSDLRGGGRRRPGVRASAQRCPRLDAGEGWPATAFAETGQPLLLPGTNRTSSFLCVPAADAHRSLYTACHGTGSIISAFERDGRSGPDPLGRCDRLLLLR